MTRLLHLPTILRTTGRQQTAHWLTLLSLSLGFTLAPTHTAQGLTGGYRDTVALSFDLPNPPRTAAANASGPAARSILALPAASLTASRAPVRTHVDRQRQLFAGGADSLVARTVGHAEGTRTAQGNKTAAYQGHVDPGNGAWNLGSFSFQHCPEAAYQCTTPEDADIYQLRRLQSQALALQNTAGQVGMRLTLVEHLNGIDLANQAPLAALGTPGYIQLLWQAHRQGLQGEDAILWSRVQSYWQPDRQRWDAPGLGNTESRIRADQSRRMGAIGAALKRLESQLP